MLGGGAATLATSSNDLAANPWTLVSLDGESVPADAGITAVFGSDGKLTGSGGCNSYTTTYQAADDGTLSLQPVAATRKSCGADADGMESAYFTLLEASGSYAVSVGQLAITAADGGTLVFTAPGGIVGTWTLSSIDGTPIPATVTATAVFAEDGTLIGTGGCNTFSATYTVDGGDIAMGAIGATRKACAADVMGVENSYLDALQSVTTFAVAGTVLTLTDTAGTVTLTFTGGGSGIPTDLTLTGVNGD